MHRRVLPLALSVLLGLAACTSGTEKGESAAAEPGVVATTTPDTRLTVVADEEPVAVGAGVSRALFDRSPVAVVARDGDRSGTLLAASAAVGLGVPLLLEPADGGIDGVLAEELGRLGVETVLSVGKADAGASPSGSAEGEYEIVSVPAVTAAVEAATGLDLGSAEQVSTGGETAAVAALDPGALVALGGQGGDPEADGDSEADGTLPDIERGSSLADTVVVVSGDGTTVAATATARAAGATVVVAGSSVDPRGLPDAEALAGAEAVLVVGAGFAAEDGLDWKVDVAVDGAQLPGGGQLLFPGRMMVALYGHPGTGALGVLGEQPLDAAIERARTTAAPYEALVDVPVVPAFEVIATVASEFPGADGNYSAEADIETLRPWVEAAGEAGLYVILDLQPGRTDFVTQAEEYRSLLELPYVGLALDPEWRLGPNEVHLTQIGSVGIDEVNQVVSWLADLTRENTLPQKLLVLHQFRVDMLPGLDQLDTSRDELALMIHADGQGGQGAKQATWRVLHANAPTGMAWGWKNFYDEDLPVLTPEETIAQVDPLPELVTYQ